MQKNRVYYRLLSISFLVIIFSFYFVFITSEKAKKNVEENRILASRPELNIGKLDPYPKSYEKFINDHFPYRGELVKVYSRMNFHLFNKSPLPDKAIIGEDGWLFMSEEKLDIHMGKKLFTEVELSKYEKELVLRKEYCEKNGIKFYFVIIPQKHSVYSEKLPYRYQNITGEKLKSQLIDYLNKKGNIECIDLEECLVNAKSKFDVFRKNDNHWNDFGAFTSVNEITNKIKKDFPEISELDIKNFNVKIDDNRTGNIAKMFSMEGELFEDSYSITPKYNSQARDGNEYGHKAPEWFPYKWEYEVVKTNPNATNLKLMVVRESFGTAQVQFWQEIFSESVFIFDGWKYRSNYDIIEIEKPDIVVLQVLESFIPNLLNNLSEENNIKKE